MAELPHMPLATDAYLADTQHLSAQEHGAYLLLLITAWRCRGRPQLPDDDRILARCAKVDPRTWHRLKPTIMAFWVLGEDGFWTQKKQLKMRELTNKRVERQRANAAARWGRKPLGNNGADDATAYPMAMPRDMQPKPINTPMVPKGTKRAKVDGYGDKANPLFADFEATIWPKRWPRPNNNPSAAFKAWAKLTDAERDQCRARIERCATAIIAERSEPKYRPMLSTWLNGRGWLAVDDAPSKKAAIDWAKNATYFRDTGEWPMGWGPRPGQPGCRCPAELLIGIAAA